MWALLLVACTGGDDLPTEPDSGVSTITPQPAEPTPDARFGGTLRIGISHDPASIDPRLVADPEAERIVGALFDPLVELDPTGQPVPAAAEDWDVLDDGARFRFRLRDATFHDGSPVTADAFKRAFDHIADAAAVPRSFLSYLLDPIVGVEAGRALGGGVPGIRVEDDRTLVIELDAPQPQFLATLAHPSLVPLPDMAFDDPVAFAQQPVGNGPFVMLEPREPEAFLRLTSFPGHHDPAFLDEIVVQVYPQDLGDQQLWDDLTGGLLDVAEVAPEWLAEAATTFGASVDGYRGPGLLDGVSSTTYMYGFNTTTPPFDDVDVRRALSLAIDRAALQDDVMQGTRVATDSLVPPSIPGSRQGLCDYCRHDPVMAARLLEEAEAEVTSVTLTHARGRTHSTIAESMASDIEEALGIDVDLRAQDLRPFVRSVRSGEVPFFWLGWEATTASADSYLHPLFHSSQIGADNVTRFADEDVDGLLDTARSIRTSTIAGTYFRSAEREILDQMPVLPLLWHRLSVVVADDVRDLYWSPLGRVDFASVWLTDRES